MKRNPIALAAVLAAVLAGAGCGGSGSAHPRTSTAAALSPQGRQIGKLSTPGTPKGEQTVPIKVIAQKGPQRAAMALVPVRIDGRGPFLFALDTGATTSLVPAALAEKLHLHKEGAPQRIEGVTGGGKAYPVRIDNWSAGSVSLPPSIVAALESSSPEPPAAVKGKGGVHGPQGLLGSDVLSRYGKIAVDYDRSLLVLDPPVR
jgi:hypothetical protein